MMRDTWQPSSGASTRTRKGTILTRQRGTSPSVRPLRGRRDVDDPEPRADGLCVVCEQPRPHVSTPLTRTLRNGPRDPYAGDPFCSAVCARSYFSVELLTPESTARHGLGSRPPWKSRSRA